jgi:flagellar biosynthesis protein FlhB
MKKRKDRSTEISITFAMIALVAAILIVYFDTAYKLNCWMKGLKTSKCRGRRPNEMTWFDSQQAGAACE